MLYLMLREDGGQCAQKFGERLIGEMCARIP